MESVAESLLHDMGVCFSAVGTVVADEIQKSKLIPLGIVNHQLLWNIPQIDDPKLGGSKSLPIGLKIQVEDSHCAFPENIGAIVKASLFPNHDPFTFNVEFACADPLTGNYGNPQSVWFNVFFGCYEIVTAGKLPFGYKVDDDKKTLIPNVDDLVRLGKADWNHFSNQLYGVPFKTASKYDKIQQSDLSSVKVKRGVTKPGWGGYFDEVQFEGVEVVTPHEPLDLGVVNIMWQAIFGRWLGGGLSKVPESVAMRAKLFMFTRRQSDNQWHTLIFGATANQLHDKIDKAENERFLSLQVDAISRLIANESNLGFASPNPQIN